MTPVDISKETAAEALRKRAVRYSDPEHPDFGRTLIHCFAGSLGADWDLDDAIRLLSKATRVAWVNHLFGHDLAILGQDGWEYCFDVKRPSPKGEGS